MQQDKSVLLRLFLADQRYIVWGQVKVPLHSRPSQKPKRSAYFLLKTTAQNN
ncbi:hypothetical protein [Okeania sp. KiyG1]|uniref:hypothetical protein n=1 Tax=Okeania sp. KiyG1 TaxID=2720165 RepID=UPI001F2368E3|nr:hypothetical protein [Okeania sp. KiyG1]